MDGLAGYAYQLVLSAIEWAALPSGGTLLLEIAEAYAVLVDSVLTMTQANNTSRTRSVALPADGASKTGYSAGDATAVGGTHLT